MPLRVVTLRCGDYALADALGIERKTGSDLARSIIDGRLFRQMGALRQCYRRPVLLIEDLTDGAETLGVHWTALRGALVSVSVCFGVPVLRSVSGAETAELILTAVRQLRQPSRVPAVRAGCGPRGWRARALHILQGLPRVGPRRAGALLGVLGSVAAVMTAEEEALIQVPGVGTSIARSIRGACGPEPERVSSEATEPVWRR
jgi:ERCC4-type nuclease